MKKVLFILSIISVLICFCQCRGVNENKNKELSYNTFCFYYNWYGNQEENGKDIHWAHPVIKNDPNDTILTMIPGGDDISSNFYPQLGAYSSTDKVTVVNHMQMLAEARIGVIVLTWWNASDFGAQSVPLIMDEAAKVGIKVCFHIEPFRGRTAQTTRDNIQTIVDCYGKHPALYRINGKPLFFVYDSYLIPSQEWATLLDSEGGITIRNTPYDAVMIGLWVGQNEEDFFAESGFDGFYTYFGSTGFTAGSDPRNWKSMQKWASKNEKIFIPCVAPGYIDTRVRPWNEATTRERENGLYYDKMFSDAIDCGTSYVGITSFNEWHEGTQIEPAKPFKSEAFDYLDYGSDNPNYYLERTAFWVEKMKEKQNNAK